MVRNADYKGGEGHEAAGLAVWGECRLYVGMVSHGFTWGLDTK